jgi:5'-nucleotidase
LKLLLSNDDGVHARGLKALAQALAEIAAIKVVAPDRDYSGASHSLTLTRPLSLLTTSEGFLAVDGTPTDSVHLGLSRLIGFEPERVVAGINSHANLGDDVLYSGTVAAAMEGRFLDLPAIAVSLVNNGSNHYETAAMVVKKMLADESLPRLTQRTVLNINVPDVPYAQVRGVQITRLGHRFKGGEPMKIQDPRGRIRYWIASAGEVDDAGEGTDFHAVKHGFVSITPINVDMTQQQDVICLQQWLRDSNGV